MGVEGEGVEIRAFRGSRRSAVYREHVLGRSALAGLQEAARDHGLPILSSLRGRSPRRLDPVEARQLALEARRLGDGVRNPVLAPHLEAIAVLAGWCARSRVRSWMTIAAS